MESIHGEEKKRFGKGETVRLPVAELLDIANIDLDERNADSGGAAPTGDLKWPIYRMTGKVFLGRIVRILFTPNLPVVMQGLQFLW